MEHQDVEKLRANPIRRFVSYEEYLKAFYPESAESNTANEEPDQTRDFGTHLAIESLNRYANILKFGDM